MSDDGSTAATGRPSPPLGGTALRAVTRTIQLVLLGVVLYTVAVGEHGQFVNATLMLAVALVPDVLCYRYELAYQPTVAFLVAAAPFLHAVGALGPYRTVPAFDQLAHAVSATLVAGLGYVVVRLLDAEYDDVEIPPKLRFAFVLIFATAFGVTWEILEFATGLVATVTGGEALLAQYGPSDVVLDLLFNSVGAVLVALWGTSYFDGLRRLARRRVVEDG